MFVSSYLISMSAYLSHRFIGSAKKRTYRANQKLVRKEEIIRRSLCAQISAPVKPYQPRFHRKMES